MVIKRHYILYFILLALFIQLSPFDEYVRGGPAGTTITNYFVTFTICFFIILFNKIPRNKDALRIIFILFCGFLINFIFAPYRNPSWFLYQVIFLLASYYTAAIYSHIGSNDYASVSRNIKKICNSVIPIIACISIYVLVKYYNILVDIYAGANVLNGYLVYLYRDFYWDKHCIGGAIVIIFCHILTLQKHKFRNFFFLLPVLPVVLAIRHLLLGFFLTAILINTRKARTLFLLFLILLVTMFVFWDGVIGILKRDVRMMGLANSVTISTEYPFGVGHGVYHTFVKANIPKLTNQYLHLYAGMPIAPESDFVYVFSSFGLPCGLIFYGIIAVMVLRLWKLYPNLTYPDKFFALVFIYFFFAGIGEDWMFGFPYWLLFGFALGVVAAKRNRFVGKSTRSRGKIHV